MNENAMALTAAGLRRGVFVVEAMESRTLLSNVPAGFTDTKIAANLTGPDALDVAADGRVFITDQYGHVRIIQNDQLVATPFADLSAELDSTNERGLLGIALDPNFASNRYVYVYYSANAPVSHNRVSRLTADPNNPNVMLPGSEQVLFDFPAIGTAKWHMGGSIQFGPDGKLYVSVGDHLIPAAAQDLNSVFGKILRVNTDGTIPTDNPFYSQTTGDNRAIWAMGLRNPYTTAFQPGTGRFFINDVGQDTWEEIEDGAAGANYGWSTTEGNFDQAAFPAFTEPLYTYQHLSGRQAITGGAFYNPQNVKFPAQYVGKYFFLDFGSGEMWTIDPSTKTVAPFASGLTFANGIDVGNDGALYYLTRGAGANGQPSVGTGEVHKIQYTASSTYLSGLPFLQTPINGWGPVEIDHSNGEAVAGDGKTITLNGQSYSRGLGVHANSDIRFNLNHQYNQFQADLGVDDEVANNGSVIFQVYVDNILTYTSPTITGASATLPISIPVSGANTLRLVVSDAGNGNAFDHADWANARLTSDGAVVLPPGALFNPPASYPTGSESHGIFAADINGDGKIDLASANAGSSTVSILLGNGDLTFAPAVNYKVGDTPKSVQGKDLNGDGKIDFVTADQGSGMISVLLNKGNGTFFPAVDYTGTSGAHEATLADLDGDGDMDIAEAGWGVGLVRVLFNNGSGVFSGGTNYSVGAAPHSVVAFDFNGDGKPDLAVADHDSANVAVLLNNGNGTYKPAVFYPVGTGTHSIRAGDVNGDGKIDLATANDGSANASVLIGIGDGTFAAAVNYGTGLVPKGVGLGDVNGDGKLDLLTANTAGNYPNSNNPGGDQISVLLNNGNGTFGTATSYTTGRTPFSLALADFDGDGDLDVATANWHTNDVTVLRNMTLNSQSPPVGNQPPIAGADGATTSSNQPVVVDVLANDSDPGGAINPATVSIIAQPTHGAVSVNSTTGAVTYTPALNYVGGDEFSYTVKDNQGAVSTNAKVSINVAAASQSGSTAYLSDLSPTASSNGWGAFERDRSNGEAGASDGKTITLNGQTYSKGLGVHAASDIQYSLAGGGYSEFRADVGVDDEVGNNGSVVFQVWLDNVKVFDSGSMTGASQTQSIVLNVSGKSVLRLVVTDGANGNGFDHADWASARLIGGTAQPPPPPPSGQTWLSDLSWASAINGWGVVEKDRSNGEQAAGDGVTLIVRGNTYTKGLGVHADSDVRFNLNAQYNTFTTDLGLDNETKGNGSVIFQIYVDGTLKFDSGIVRGTDAVKNATVSVAGAQQLRLVVTSGGDGNAFDHADWAGAKLIT